MGENRDYKTRIRENAREYLIRNPPFSLKAWSHYDEIVLGNVVDLVIDLWEAEIEPVRNPEDSDAYYWRAIVEDERESAKEARVYATLIEDRYRACQNRQEKLLAILRKHGISPDKV